MTQFYSFLPHTLFGPVSISSFWDRFLLLGVLLSSTLDCCVLPVLSCPLPDRLATCTQSHMSRRDFLKRAPKGNQYPPFNDQKYFHSCQCSEIFCPLYMTSLNRRCPPPCESFCVLCCSQTLCLDSVVRVEDCRSVARPSPLPYVLPPLVFVIFNQYLVCSQTDSSFFLTQKALFTTFEVQH